MEKRKKMQNHAGIRPVWGNIRGYYDYVFLKKRKRKRNKRNGVVFNCIYSN